MSVAHTTSTGRPHAAPRRAARFVNPLIARIAGTRLMPFYGVLKHRGRRSGRTFSTPVVVRPTADGFIVPMPWGEQTDWYRNVRAAGGCTIRWKGRDYPMQQPEVISADEAAAVFKGPLRGIMRRFGINSCLRLHHRS
jgi:deazaflavin-dependent oxidoreductase (nitroreductase family)